MVKRGELFACLSKGLRACEQSKNGKLEAELLFINTVHKQGDFHLRGRGSILLNNQSHFRRVRAFPHVHEVRTAGSQRLEMLCAMPWYNSLPFTMNGNEKRYLPRKQAKNIAITRYRCGVINPCSKAFCFSHDFHCRKLS